MDNVGPGSIIKGYYWPEPVEVKLIEELGDYIHIVGATTDEAFRLEPENAAAYQNRGLSYFTLGQLDQSINDFNEAIRLNPEDEVSYFFRGDAYCSLGQFEQGIKDYDETIRLKPENAITYRYRGTAYKEQGKKAEAIADFKKFISLTDNPQWIQMARQQIEELSE